MKLKEKTFNSQTQALLDEKFLATLSEQRERDIYARIIALDVNENPIDQIEGKVSGGSISIDGNSSVRRTCSLTMVSYDIDIKEYYWGLKTKFKLEIGLRNKLTGEYAPTEENIYPEIIWFPQGYFVIAAFNTQISTNSCTISLSGKDKMCLLNGDLSGQLFAQVDFGTEEEVANVMEQVTITDTPSSESLALKDYYLKSKKQLDSVFANHPQYSFVYNQLEGNYYKDGNFYRYEADPENENAENKKIRRQTSHKKYYEMYQLVEDPVDLYESIEVVPYHKDTYYCKDSYGVLKSTAETAEKPDKNKIYYTSDGTLVNVYIPDKYYYLKYTDIDEYGNLKYIYYILDSTSTQTENRTYYKIVPLYQKFSNITKRKITIEEIIREAVHTYASEPYHNIIINDLDDYGLEQLTYKGDVPLYALYDVKHGEFTNLKIGDGSDSRFESIINQIGFHMNPLIDSITSFDGTEIAVYRNYFLGSIHRDSNGHIDYFSISDDPETGRDEVSKVSYGWHQKMINGEPQYQMENGEFVLDEKGEKIPEMEQDDLQYIKTHEEILKIYTVAKIEYGTDVGYRLTDLVYPGDLIANVGETLTSVLDKIKNMLGDFEYFYDESGRFVFQRKKTYVNVSWSQLTDSGDETYVDYANDKQKFSFNFENGRLISSIQNQPTLNNLRNDYVVWGKRKGVSGADIPIHARYAIDKKPVYYKALNNQIYTTDIAFALQQEGISDQTYQNKQTGQDYINRINNFQLQYNAGIYGLVSPERKDSGGWTPGWWDIRDWAAYYKLVTKSSKDPNGTMKFYSTGDGEGCMPISELNFNNNVYSTQTNGSTWLIVINKGNPNHITVNFGHGSGTYNPNQTRVCTYYETDLETGTTRATGRTESFPPPYSGCSDDHTYQYFLKMIQSGNSEVFFYNPNFPFGVTEEEIISEQIAEDYKKWEEKLGIHIVDWREIIYQMSLDYFAGQGCSSTNPIYIGEDYYENEGSDREIHYSPMTDPDHFLYEVGKRNPYFYPTGYTGYEQYYTDMQGFWRQLYNPDYIPDITYSTGRYENKIIRSETNPNSYTKRKVWIPPQIEDYTIEYYVSSAKEAIYQQKKELDNLIDNTLSGSEREKQLKELQIKYEKCMPNLYDSETAKKVYWNCEVFSHPETLNFWIDFLDSDAELAQFAVKQVGTRSKVVNEDKAQAIIYSEIPNFILYDKNARKEDGTCDQDKLQANLRREIALKSGYHFIYLSQGFSQFFSISYRTSSVKNKIDELLYQYGYCIENISITAMPVYYLKPNTRIFIQDQNTGIDGEYIVSKLTIPLTYNGTMSIIANKAPDRLY